LSFPPLELADPVPVPTLHTDRLVLRLFRDSDIDAYAAMCVDPAVMRYVGDRHVLNREDAWRQMAMFVGHWQLRGFGMWAVEELSTGAFVGRVGLHFPEGWPDREVGWALVRRFWGQGYAFEASNAALTYAFDTLGWERAISLIDPDNARSIRLAQRLGQHRESDTEVRGHRVALYAVRRADWRGPAITANNEVMTMSRVELASLLRETGAAHHRAFASSDGDDPDWSRWYAEYLMSRLPERLARAYSLDTLAALLARLDEQYRAAGVVQPWAEYYAHHLTSGALR